MRPLWLPQNKYIPAYFKQSYIPFLEYLWKIFIFYIYLFNRRNNLCKSEALSREYLMLSFNIPAKRFLKKDGQIDRDVGQKTYTYIQLYIHVVQGARKCQIALIQRKHRHFNIKKVQATSLILHIRSQIITRSNFTRI